MNRSFKSIFNRHTGTWQAVSETAKAQGKTKSLSVAAASLVIVGASAFMPNDALSDNLLVGAGGLGGSSSSSNGGGGGIGGGGGGGRGGGGGGIGGGNAYSTSQGGHGGSGSLSGGNGGPGSSAGGNGNIGGGGGGTLISGGGGAIGGLGGAGATGRNGGDNGGGGGGGDSSGQSGTYDPTQIVDSYTHTTVDTYAFLGVGGGGGGGSDAIPGGGGQNGIFTLTGDVTINRSALIGGAGGGGGWDSQGGNGGEGQVILQAGGKLTVSETLLIGGSGGGEALFNGRGGNGGSGSITLENASTLSVGNALVLGGAKGEDKEWSTLGGAGGTGTLNLSGQLAFDTGAQFTINQNGTFNIGNATANDATAGTITGISSLTNNGVINFNQSNTSTTFDTAITGSGSVNHNSSGTTILTGTNTYTGGTSITAGTLQIGNGSTTGSITGNTSIASGATLAFNRSNDLTYSGVISGSGNLTKLGDGALTLNGSSSSTVSELRVSDGTLNIHNEIHSTTGVVDYTGGDTSKTAVVNVSGANAVWENTGALSVGFNGTCTLNIENGGKVTSGGGAIGGRVGSGIGIVNITGDASWNLTSYLHVGGHGTGTVNITGGGTLTTTSFASIGSSITSPGTGDVFVSGLGSKLDVTSSLTLGGEGKGHLTIEQSGLVSSNFVELGYPGPLRSDAEAILQLNGVGNSRGVLSTGYITKRGNGTRNTFNWDGGILQATRDESNFLRNLSSAEVVIGSNGAFFDTNSHNVGITTALQGTGTGGLTKLGLGTLTLSGVNTYDGGTRIDAGTLLIASTGSLASPTTVNNSGTLGGTGSTGDVVVNSGGVLAPGNSIGTLTVNGNLTMNTGSIYQVEANAAGDSDMTIVNGTATLNGNVVALPDSGGSYKADTKYTILTAANPLIGQFNSNVTSSLAFLDASIAQDTYKVYLNLRRNDINYADVATTRNQRNVATALQNTFAAGNGTAAMDDVLTSVNNLSADKARAAFDSMSGVGLVGLQRAAANFTGNFSNQLNSRLQSAGMGRTAQSINGVQLAANDRLGDLMPALAQNTRSDVPSSGKFSMGGGVPVDDGKRGFWLRGYGFDQDTDGDGNAASTRIKGVGISAGFDKRIQNNLVVGAAFSHGTSDVRASFAETGKSRGNAIAAYASYATGPWTFNGNLMLAHNANTMNRNVTVGALSSTARANFDSKTVSTYGEASYDLPQATWTLQPLAGLSVAHNRNDGFSEIGAGALNIQAASQSITSTKTLFGARALFEFDGIHVQPRAIWAHEFGDVNKGMTAQLQGSPAATFTTYGVDLPRDSLITGVTVAGKTKDGFSLFADVQGEFNSKQTGLALLVGMRKSW